MYINKIVKLLLLIIAFISLYACDQKKEDKESKRKKKALESFVALEAKYEAFIPEPFDDVLINQEALGLKWYIDSKEYPPTSPELLDSTEEADTTSNLLTPFTLHIYKSDDVKNIELSYNLDRDSTHNWSPLYQVESLDAKKTSLSIDYQDYKLFGFDFFLPPAMLRATMTWSDDVVHELYIDPENQKDDVHIKGFLVEGIISDGIFENQVLVLRNISGLTWTVEVNYTDARLKDGSGNKNTKKSPPVVEKDDSDKDEKPGDDNNQKADGSTPNNDALSENQRIVFTLKTNISRILHISSFMTVESIVIKTPYEDFHQLITPDKVFSPGALVGCVVMNFTPENLTVTPVLEDNFSSCYPDFKDYKSWVLSKIPELNEKSSDTGSIKGKLPSMKIDD